MEQQIASSSTQQKHTISFNFGMAAFETVISDNFRSIEGMLTQQQAQMDRLRTLVEGFQRSLSLAQQSQGKKQSIESGKVGVGASSPGEDATVMQAKAQQKQEQTISSPQKQTTAKPSRQQPENINAIDPSTPEGESPLLPAHNQLNQTDLPLSQAGIKLINSDIMEEKVFQLFERVRQLQERGSNSERFSLKKFRELEFQLAESGNAAEKNRKAIQEFDATVEALRNQISEYKLKKESKILKVLNSSANLNQTSSGQSYDYMADKIQFLLKHVSEMLTKRAFEDEREALHQNIQGLRRKLAQSISEGFFQESMKALEGRIYQSVAKHLKALQFSPGEKGERNEQLDSIIEEGNKEFSRRVSQHEEKIKAINEQLSLLKTAGETSRKERLQLEEEYSEQMRLTQEKCELLGLHMDDTQKYIQELKKSLTEKQLQSENQIIDLQQSLDKLSSNLKSYTFSASKDTPLRSSYTPMESPESQPALEKVGSNVEIENDLKSQQKKFNKLQGKVQGLKEDILAFREDLIRELDGVKAGLEKKADWESLKKGLNYFEEKLKETKAVTQALYESAGKEQGGDSLAVKKGWTCLMCDKDIKSYQGKLGELKFTSMFPVRQSPRIGGYYKQQQANQEYKQVFLSNSNLNNRSRRIGSLKSKDSKEDLH